MGFVSDILVWAQATFGAFGAAGLFAVAFMESSFFPIPPDILLIPLALAVPELALFYALVTTIGSVLGAIFGYYIGIKGGRPLLRKFASEKTVDKVDRYFKNYGDAAIAIAAFTPIPYKIFTIAAGVFRHKLRNLVLISIPCRGARFFLEAGIILLWGKEIVALFDNGTFEWLTVAVTAVAIVGYVIYRKFIRKRKNIQYTQSHGMPSLL